MGLAALDLIVQLATLGFVALAVLLLLVLTTHVRRLAELVSFLIYGRDRE